MKTTIITLITLLVLAALAGAILIFGGFIDVAADNPESAAKEWLLGTIMEESVIREAADIDAPPLDDRQRLLAGVTGYDEMCVSCHGAPGVDAGAFAQHMSPAPPPLEEEAEEWTAAQLFWITKHGIEMTGMPAWGPTHGDEELWDLVAVVQKLPELSANEYQALLEEAKGSGGSGHHHDEPH